MLKRAEQLAHAGLQLTRRRLLTERLLHLIPQVDERVTEHVAI